MRLQLPCMLLAAAEPHPSNRQGPVLLLNQANLLRILNEHHHLSLSWAPSTDEKCMDAWIVIRQCIRVVLAEAKVLVSKGMMQCALVGE